MGKASQRKKDATARGAKPPEATAAEPRVAAPDDGNGAAPFPTALLILLGVGAVFRLAYFLQYRTQSILFDSPILDAAVYEAWARRIAAGEWAPPGPFYFAPGYPYALALFHALFPWPLPAAYVFQLVCGLACIALIHRLTRAAFGGRAALFAAVLASLYAAFPFFETKPMATTLALTVLLAALAVLEAAARQTAAWRWATAGLLLGLTSLFRPETLLAAPFFVFWIYRWAAPAARAWGAPSRGAVAATALLLAAWAVAISPATLHNLRAGGGSNLISSQGGITFYQANNERARGLYSALSRQGFSGAPDRQEEEEKALAEKALGRPLSRSEVTSYWFGRGLAFVREQPGRFLWLLGMKLLRFAGSYEYSTEYILYVERENVWLLWLPFVPFALILALAVPSLVVPPAARRDGRRHGPRRLNAAGGLLAVTLAANVAVVLIFYVSSRYRISSVPALTAFAGATLASLWSDGKAGRRSRAGIVAGSVAVLFVLLHFEKDSSATFEEANAHFNIGNVWAEKKLHEEAVKEYRRAIAMVGSRYQYHVNLGNSLRDLGRHAEAAEAYGQAGALRPRFANAHLQRAQMLVETGDWAGARQACERVLEIKPDQFDAHLLLGRIAARLGDRKAAVEHLDRAMALRPDSQAARAARAGL